MLPPFDRGDAEYARQQSDAKSLLKAANRFAERLTATRPDVSRPEWNVALPPTIRNADGTLIRDAE